MTFSAKSLNVLLVEDDEDDFILTRNHLAKIEAAHITLDWADDYGAAVRLIEEKNHDVYLLDYRLGERTGLDVASHLVAQGSMAPIILLTGQAELVIEDGDKDTGISDYLVKGEITPSLLERTILYAVKQKKAEARALHLAFHDPLTGLPNRALLWDRLAQTISRHQRQQRFGAMVYLDIDNFKTINDSLGHSVGDGILVEFARRLTEKLRKSDTAARLGGDEFVLVLEELSHSPAKAAIKAHHFAENLQARLNRPIHKDDHVFHVSSSVGISIFPGDADDPETILKYADTAMYKAKAAGRNAIRIFEPTMGEEVQERLVMEADLRDACAGRAFELHYQPQVDIFSGRIIGAESLLRWNRDGKGLVYPNDFIPLAEQSDIILAIGFWVLRTACAQLKDWPDLPFLSVNVSAKQFLDPNFTRQVDGLLEEFDIDPPRLEIELTETCLLADEEATSRSIRALKDRGISICLDDFGTGYSSLSYLKRLPFDAIKIDRSFVSDITRSSDDAAITEAIITLGRILKLTVVAEGVETEAQLNILSERGCAIAQGFYFSPAVRAEDFQKLSIAKP